MEVKLQWTGIRLLIELFVWVQLPRLPPFSYRRGIMAVHRSPKANYAGSIPAAYAI